jgi:hypothetical protein
LPTPVTDGRLAPTRHPSRSLREARGATEGGERVNATARHPDVTRGEALAVAGELSRPVEELRAIKMDSQDGSTHFGGSPPPQIRGFDAPKEQTLTYLDERSGNNEPRPVVRYDSLDGTVIIIIVEHESGAAIWQWITHTAEVVSLLGGITALVDWVRAQTSGAPTDPKRVTVDGNGENTSEPWDGKVKD